MTIRAPGRVLVTLCMMVMSGCSCGADPVPPDDNFDGNVVIGMGGPDGGLRDAGRDSGVRDAGTDVRDGGRDAGGDPADSGVDDAGEVDGGDPCAVVPAATLSAAEAVAQAATWDGQVISVVGTATRTPYNCTRRPCSEKMPCCNTCTADILIGGTIELTADACFGATVHCSGTECAQVCVPAIFEVDESFIGRLRAGPPVRLELFEVGPSGR